MKLSQAKARTPLVLAEADTFLLHLLEQAQESLVGCGDLCYGIPRAVPNRS